MRPDLAHATDLNVRLWADRYRAYRSGEGADPGPPPTYDLQGRTVTAGDIARALAAPMAAPQVAFVNNIGGNDGD